MQRVDALPKELFQQILRLIDQQRSDQPQRNNWSGDASSRPKECAWIRRDRQIAHRSRQQERFAV
jgi:hypothetical protein